MRKTIKRIIAGVMLLMTLMSSFSYALEFDELYRGEDLGALWYSEFDSEGTGVNQMEGLVYIDGVLTSVPATCINPDVPGMVGLDYGDLYSSNVSKAGAALRKAMFYGHATKASAAQKAEYYETYVDVSLEIASARGYGGGYAYLVTHHAAAKVYGDPNWNSGGYGTVISQALQNDANEFISRITNLPEPPDNYEVHIAKKKDYQDYAFEIIRPEEKGYLTLRKSTANGGISKDNRCYSLIGTTFEVYDNANLSGSPVATLVIKDEAGTTDSVQVKKGTYWFKETKAGPGYAVKTFDKNTDYVEVTAANKENNPATLTIQNPPQNNPVDILIAKLDKETGEASPQGEGTLKGAEFTVSYFDGYYETEAAAIKGGEAKATWKFVTDENGQVKLHDSYKVSGPSFYTDTNGNPTLPLGTIVIKETKAPTGYLPSDEVWVKQITVNTDVESVSTLNTYTVKEQIIRGGVKGIKIDHDRNKAIPQGDATLEGAEFTVYDVNGNETIIIKTKSDGSLASDPKALPFGSYTIKETKAPTGYHLNTKWMKEFSITKNGEIADLSGEPTDEPVYRGGVKISKIDSDLDKAYSQGDATLEGAEFTIYNNSAESVYVNGKEYAKGQAVLTIKTDKNGNSTTKEDTLPYGTYTIKETKPSKGYLLNKEWNKPFEVREPGVIVDLTEDPTEEPVIRGGVKIAKIDAQLIEAYAQGDATLEGAEFTIYNKSKQNVFVDGKEYKPGDAVKVITTNKEGIAEAPKDSLPYGSYLIKETKPSEGYLLNETWEKPFEIREEGVVIDLTEEPTPETVMRGGVQIIKRDKELENSEALGGATLSGIEMTVKNVSGHDVLVRSDISSEEKVDWSKATFAVTAEPTEGNESSEEASSEATSSIKRVKPGEDIGKIIVHWNEEKKAYTAETLPDDLPYGTYTIRESKTNSSYQRTDKTEHKFEVREDGTVYSYDNAVKDINGDEANAVDTTEATEGNTQESEAYNDTFVFDNYVYRSDVQGTKIGDGDSVRFSYVPFKITSVSTGETHVVMTDKNGFFTTKDRRTKDALEEDESGETARIQNPLDDLMEAKDLTKEILEKRSDEILYGVWFGTGEFESKAEMNNSFGALPYDSYVIEEMSCEQNSGYTLQKFFFTVDEKSQNGFVDLETITDDVPEIGTEASIDGKNANVSPKKEITLVDTIEYRGFKKGETYIAKGKLIDKATGNLMLDAEGKEIISETEFVAKKVNGKVKVTFNFDGSNMWGKDTVVFETVYDTEGHVIAKHEDPDDEGQTVTWEKAEPSYEMYKIRTTKAPSKGDKFGFFALDEVEYEVYVENTGNVILTMDVQDKFVEGEECFTSPLLKAVKFEGEGTWNNEGKSDNVANITINPKETAIITYTATIKDEAKEYLAAAAKDSDSLDAKSKDTNMTYQMNEPDDKDGYLNEASCENVTYPNPDKPEEPNKLEPKKDIAQTPVQKPEIGTTLTGEDGSKTIISSEKTVLVDTVAYKGLDPSKWHTVMGTLMVKETGDPFVENGTPVSVESEPFKPKKSEGEIDITFVINTKGLEGKELVAFEVILRLDGYEEGKDLDQVEKKPIAEHNDINDEGQTVKIVKPEEPEKPEEPKTPEKPETPKVSNPPETGDTSRISMYAGIGLVALLSLLLAAYAHEQKDRTGGKENRKNNR